MTETVTLILFIVFAAVGGFLRFFVEYRFPPTGRTAFPMATLCVNIIGSFILGLVVALPSLWHVALGTGLCGALTTFSGVSLQLTRRLRSGDLKQALFYFSALISAGLLSAWAGIQLGQSF